MGWFIWEIITFNICLQIYQTLWISIIRITIWNINIFDMKRYVKRYDKMTLKKYNTSTRVHEWFLSDVTCNMSLELWLTTELILRSLRHVHKAHIQVRYRWHAQLRTRRLAVEPHVRRCFGSKCASNTVYFIEMHGFY